MRIQNEFVARNSDSPRFTLMQIVLSLKEATGEKAVRRKPCFSLCLRCTSSLFSRRTIELHRAQFLLLPGLTLQKCVDTKRSREETRIEIKIKNNTSLFLSLNLIILNLITYLHNSRNRSRRLSLHPYSPI